MEIAAANSFIRRLQLHPEILDQFREVMIRYSCNKLDVSGVVSELDTLFQFHRDLLTGYRYFLPLEFRPSSPSPSPSRQSRKKHDINADMLNPCIDFMNKVQKRFGDERGVIRAYLETIRGLTQGKLSYKDACRAIAEIFGNENQDLIDEFKLVLLGDNNGVRSTTRIQKKNSEGRRMEEEMCELDVKLSRVMTIVQAAKTLRDLLSKQQHQKININDHFSALSLSCVRKEFKEQGPFVVQQLLIDPKLLVLPQILDKFESNERKLVKERDKLHEYWCGVQEKKQNSVTNSSV
ncbi:hypothetical protein FXO38_19105 [Capsicum annuum]|uniref:Uncharacterized protein n=1 Tax=Capsicum annuum TaxID=4072 RepID=A0A2G2ZGB1_CAPAN|nr:hypothetical protein FXO38_19105 [Capsicum annuum]KAF3649413.1 hypothetical protein FXO37_18976 [Capsicum annuum]PHT81030.1 hypothetical protein T459_14045 [Capsicum annuum]